MTLVKTDLDRRPLRAPAGPPEELHCLLEAIRDEHDLTVAEVLRLTGQDELLAANPLLDRTLGCATTTSRRCTRSR